ncbi:MAG TPA: bifunctional sugar-1-phosphate nucleotidylyltransferase/acetyltransferase [Methanomassiliicoccales archaeon]|nr:bifunctional sugar-1-phosphate nucleotidylyltransferase/acetyltransferase [Methanomassiliicoccales archaeon]
MKAVILAAGEGTRLRPFTVSRPKVMIPIGNRPILEYVVRALAANGITDIVLVVGYMKERIMSFFGNGSRFGVKISYAIQEKQLGTAHAALAVRQHIKEEFIMVAGDNIIDAQVITDLLKHKGGMSLLVTSSEMPSKYGVVQIEAGRVVDIIEKPEKGVGNIINTGIYRFPPEIFDYLAQGVMTGKSGITHVLHSCISKLNLEVVRSTGRWMDAVYPWDLIRLNEYAFNLTGQVTSGTIEAGVTLRGPVFIGAGTRVRAGSYIEGPVAIGEGCEIGPYATIFPTSSIGNGVHVAPFTAIYNSIIMNNVSIGSHSHISRAVIDDGCRIGTGFSASSGLAQVRVEEEFFKVEKAGSMIGEFTKVGPKAVLSAGTIVGANSRIGDGARASGTLEDRSIVV